MKDLSKDDVLRKIEKQELPIEMNIRQFLEHIMRNMAFVEYEDQKSSK